MEKCKTTVYLFLVAKLQRDMGVELVHWLRIDIASQNFYSGDLPVSLDLRIVKL